MVAGVTPESHQAPRWYQAQHLGTIRCPDSSMRYLWEPVPRWKQSHQVPRWHQALYLGAIRCISIDLSLALHHPTPSTVHSGGSLDHLVETGRKRGNRETVVETVVETVGKVLETMESLLYFKREYPYPFSF